VPENHPKNDFLDLPRPVRKEDTFNEDKLLTYLKQVLPHLEGPLEVRQFPSGHSNLTYLLRMKDQDLVLRRPPRGKEIKTAHDMEREYRVLSSLQEVYPRVPRPLVYCEDPEVLGAPFYIMERIQGVILRGKEPPARILLTEDVMRQLCCRMVDHLVELHKVDLVESGLRDFGKPEGYIQRQVTGWTKRYFNAKTDSIPKIEQTAAWLKETMPVEERDALIHNDYKYDNLVLDPQDLTRIMAVLDWEMATVGDPFMDVGTTLGYWLDPQDPDPIKMLPFGPTLMRGNLDRAHLVERYENGYGLPMAHPVFYYVYGLFKIAVIAQQIYKRYKDGFSQDKRFAMMILGVQILGDQAILAIEKGRIYDLG